jgi:hypothetical protein
MDLSTATRATPKLRSSCDACGDAKTKCDRNRPQCGRCIALNLSCVYGPSRQFGKRPRRLKASRPAAATPAIAPAADVGAAVSTDALALDSGNLPPTDFDPTFLASLPPNWLDFDGTQYLDDTSPVSLDRTNTLDNPSPPHTDLDCDRFYLEANDIFQSLTVHRNVFSPETVQIEMSRVLEANKSALQSVSRFLNSDHARRMPHLTMLNANILTRILKWYQHVAGFGDLFVPRKDEPSTAGPTIGDTTPPSDDDYGPVGNPGTGCFAIRPQSFSLGNFSVEEPCMQQMFRNQLLCYEVKKAGVVIDKLVELGADERVAAGDRNMYSALAIWLKNEHAKTAKVFLDAIKRSHERFSSLY